MRTVQDATVPARQPGEGFREYLERIARMNGWLSERGKAEEESDGYRDSDDVVAGEADGD